VTHWWQVQRRDEVILDELGESGDLLVFFLHDLDVLCELDDSLAVRLKSKLSYDSELNLSAEWEDNLLVPDHTVPRLLLGCQDTPSVRGTLEC